MNKSNNPEGLKLPTEEDMACVASELSARREKKKIVRRRSGDSEDSKDSRRSFKASKPLENGIHLAVQPKSQLQIYDSVDVTPKLKTYRE